MKSFLIILALIIPFSGFSQIYFTENISSSTSKHLIEGNHIFMSEKSLSAALLTSPTIDGKKGRMNVEIKIISGNSIYFDPTKHIEIQILKKDKLKEKVFPISRQELEKKLRANFNAQLIAGSFSRGYSNSLSGNKQINYQSRTSGTISTNSGTRLYSSSQRGTINYYDQNEVDRRNIQSQNLMINQKDRFEKNLNDLLASLLYGGNLNVDSYIQGEIFFESRIKKADKLIVKITLGNEIHTFIMK